MCSHSKTVAVSVIAIGLLSAITSAEEPAGTITNKNGATDAVKKEAVGQADTCAALSSSDPIEKRIERIVRVLNSPRPTGAPPDDGSLITLGEGIGVIGPYSDGHTTVLKGNSYAAVMNLHAEPSFTGECISLISLKDFVYKRPEGTTDLVCYSALGKLLGGVHRLSPNRAIEWQPSVSERKPIEQVISEAHRVATDKTPLSTNDVTAVISFSDGHTLIFSRQYVASERRTLDILKALYNSKTGNFEVPKQGN